MDEFIDTNEKRWINRARKLFKEKPPELQVYVVDDTCIICKDGVSCDDFSADIAQGFEATNMLGDVHYM